MPEPKLKELFEAILGCLKGLTPHFDVHDERDVLIVFLRDMMEYGLGTDIFVEVEGLSEAGPKFSQDYLNRSASVIGETVGGFVPGATVDCEIKLPYATGYWTNAG